MNEYISIGNLATDLKTSNQKLGQIIDSLEIERRTMRDGKWYNRCVAVADVGRIIEAMKDFRVDQNRGRTAKKYEKKVVHFVGCNSPKLFKDPIISVDLKRGVTGGQGIWAWWAKESYEIVREGLWNSTES